MPQSLPLAAFSHKMVDQEPTNHGYSSPAEKNYETHDRECLAVVHRHQAWRCYLEGVESTCVTDHHPLTYLQTQPRINRRQARWMEFLASFRPHIVYRPGKANPARSLVKAMCRGTLPPSRWRHFPGTGS
jgi:hypothetical protein